MLVESDCTSLKPDKVNWSTKVNSSQYQTRWSESLSDGAMWSLIKSKKVVCFVFLDREGAVLLRRMEVRCSTSAKSSKTFHQKLLSDNASIRLRNDNKEIQLGNAD